MPFPCIASLFFLCSCIPSVQTAYQLNLFFQPPIPTNDGLVDVCIQYLDNESFDDFLTHCLILEDLPKWKPKSLSFEAKTDYVVINDQLITISYKVKCYPNFFGSNCDKYCKAELSESNGFFDCSNEGEKVCLEGFQGPNCTIPSEREREMKDFMSFSLITHSNFNILLAAGVTSVLFLLIIWYFICAKRKNDDEAKVFISNTV